MFIRHNTHTIEMTKKFAKAAEKFGSDEYKDLQAARRDYPNFKIVIIRKSSGKKDTFKGLSYEFMESYIKKHDDDEQSIMAEYLMLRGLSDEAKENLAEAHSYGAMKKWFLNKFEDIAKYHENCAKLVTA